MEIESGVVSWPVEFLCEKAITRPIIRGSDSDGFTRRSTLHSANSCQSEWIMPSCAMRLRFFIYSILLSTTLSEVSAAEESFAEIRVRAEQGDAQSQTQLGYCYSKGLTVPKDYVEALKWYRKSADQGRATGQYNVGRCYELGEGVDKNATLAATWYRKGAEQGHAQSQSSLGRCYDAGEGMQKNQMEAARWFRKSAEQGYDTAQNNLGLYCANGTCVPKDIVEAYKWYNLSAAQGNQVAIGNRAGLEKKMTSEQIIKAQKLSREWKPNKAR